MSELEKIASDYITPSRTKYQIKHFVVGAHDTPEMQYRQILIEAQNLAYQIRLAEITQAKLQIEIDRLASSTDELDALDIEEKQVTYAYNAIALEGAKREMTYLQELFSRYPHYTNDDIENNQPEYWKKRLIRQAETDRASVEQGISVGNLESLLSAGLAYQTKAVGQ